MVFNSKKDLIMFLKAFQLLGSGSQGRVYYNKNNHMVYKIYEEVFDEYFDEYSFNISEEDVLQFSHLKNSTYYFPIEVIKLENRIIGYTSKYFNGKLLCDTNPLLIKYDDFEKACLDVYEDINYLSNNNVLTFDVMYNIMYGNKKIRIIDTDEYSYNYKLATSELLKENNYNFNLGIMLFLVDSYFDEFVNSNKLLSEMYKSCDVNLREFLIQFKKSLSEYADKDINRLIEAKKLINKNNNYFPKYIRNYR